MRRVLLAAAFTVALVGTVATSAPESGVAAAGGTTTLGECPKHARPQRLRCATLTVPLERADPSLGTIPIRFAVRRRGATNRPSKGTIFAVEGDPGYGSIASARYYIHMLGPLLERRDLVTVDMRGTGHSRAIDCPDLQRGRGSDAHGVAQCARVLGPTLGSSRTPAAADDLDAVRTALGLERISMYGDSYGTYLAQSYAYRHGETHPDQPGGQQLPERRPAPVPAADRRRRLRLRQPPRLLARHSASGRSSPVRSRRRASRAIASACAGRGRQTSTSRLRRRASLLPARRPW